MKFRTLLLLFVMAAVVAFIAANWSAFLAPATLSLGLASVVAPLGIVMLGILAIVTAVFLTFLVSMQTSVLFETRRHARELRANRELADQAEASRFIELRRYIESEFQTRVTREDDVRGTLLARIDHLERALATRLQESENSFAARLGELDHRLTGSTYTDRPATERPTSTVRREH